MSDLVGNPEDRFSHNEAQMMFAYAHSKGTHQVYFAGRSAPMLFAVKIVQYIHFSKAETTRFWLSIELRTNLFYNIGTRLFKSSLVGRTPPLSSPKCLGARGQRTNGPVNARLISWPSKDKKYKTMKIYGKEMTLTFNTHIPS